MTAAAPRAPSPPEDRPLAAEPPSSPRSPACSPPAMEGREDVECDCQEAFAEAQRWVEVRRLSFLWCVAPSSPAVPFSWRGRAGRHPCSPAPGRGLAAPLRGEGGRTLPWGCPIVGQELQGRGSQTSFLCQQLHAAIFRRYRKSLRRYVLAASPPPPSPKSKLKAGVAILLSLRLIISCHLINYFSSACSEAV